MDTDDLTKMARNAVIRAAFDSNTLTAEPGAMARRNQCEGERFLGSRDHLAEIADDPTEYANSCDLENEEGIGTILLGWLAQETCLRVNGILAIRLNNRGARAW